MTTMCWVSMSASMVSVKGSSRTVQAKACQLGAKHNQIHTRSNINQEKSATWPVMSIPCAAVLAQQTGCYVTTMYMKDSESMPRPVMSTS